MSNPIHLDESKLLGQKLKGSKMTGAKGGGGGGQIILPAPAPAK